MSEFTEPARLSCGHVLCTACAVQAGFDAPTDTDATRVAFREHLDDFRPDPSDFLSGQVPDGLRAHYMQVKSWAGFAFDKDGLRFINEEECGPFDDFLLEMYYDRLGIFLEKTNMNNDDWYPGCQRERDILEDKGKVPRHVRFELNDNIREAGLSGEWWRMGDDELGVLLQPLVEKFVMDA